MNIKIFSLYSSYLIVAMKKSIVPCIARMATALLFASQLSSIYGEAPLPSPKTYHVSASYGSDQHSGLEKGLAFRTLGAAANLMQAGDNCIIYAGVYRETLVPSNNGSPEAPIAFMAAPGEKVVLSGLDVVSKWQAGAQGRYHAPMNWNHGSNLQVFRDGKLLTEARWPNRKSDEFFNMEGAKAETEGSSFDRLHCKTFPREWGAEELNGATVWCMALYRWASWTAPVKSFSKEQQTLFVEGHDTWWVKENHNPGKLPSWGEHHPAEFFISNAKVLLDAPGEWYYDPSERSLSMVVDEGDDPNRSLIEAKRRLLAIDLSNKKHIKVEGLHLMGASVAMKAAENCSLARLVVEYPSHTRGGFTAMQVPEAKGIFVSGRYNSIAHCEISRSSGSGITVEGSHNIIFNNYIHHSNSIAAYCVAVKLSGEHHRIIHNTIAMSGRDGLGVRGKAHLIQYNDIYEAGKICHDTGAIYGGGADGDNTEVSYNWVHDINTNLGIGIYFDNYTSNYNIHHNIVWNTSNPAMQLNQPSHYVIATHNTLYGKLSADFSPWKGQKTMFGSLIANNLVGSALELKPGYTEVSNYIHSVKPSRREFNPNDISFNLGKGKGIVVPGVSQNKSSSVVDCGAQESGLPTWRAGHNFSEVPTLSAKALSLGYYRNYIENGSFGERYSPKENALSGWSVVAGQVDVKEFDGWNDPPADSRNAVYCYSLVLSGQGISEVKQLTKGLIPGKKFVLAGYVKNENAQELIFRVVDGKEEIASAKYSTTETAVWRHLEVHFTVPENPSSVSVEIQKCGAGTAYVDNVGLSPIFENSKLNQ